MNYIFKTYHNLLIKFPIGIQAVQTGVLMGSGDLIAQIFVEKKPLKNLDFVRTSQFTFIGTFFVGPPLRVWYGLLDKYFGKEGKKAVLKKVASDQLLFAPIFLGVIMGIVGLVQGSSGNQIVERLKHSYQDVLTTNYKFWPAIQLCNFYFIPLKYQVLTVQVVAVFWNTYLSWKLNQEIPDSLPRSSRGNVQEKCKAVPQVGASPGFKRQRCQAESYNENESKKTCHICGKIVCGSCQGPLICQKCTKT